MRQQETALLFATITTALILVTSILTSSASAYLKIFSPKQGQQVPAGSFLPVIGTSTPSNATHKAGINQVEGQFMCFAATGTTPNFIKHLVHNFTGIQTNSGIPAIPTFPH